MFEFFYGIYASKGGISKKRIAEAEALFSRLEIFPLNERGARTAALLLGKLARKGMLINVLDGLVAGILIVHQCNCIVTRNVKDFSRISELRLETY